MTDIYKFIEEKATIDFDNYDFADKPMEIYRASYIYMMIPIVIDYINSNNRASMQDISNFIHELNGIFFFGVAAGQNFERERNN